jgi:hypothetical protein
MEVKINIIFQTIHLIKGTLLTVYSTVCLKRAQRNNVYIFFKFLKMLVKEMSTSTSGFVKFYAGGNFF